MKEIDTVVLVSDFGYINGGANAVVVRIIQGLRASGIDVVFIYGIGPLAPELAGMGIRSYDLATRQLGASRLAALTTIWNHRVFERISAILNELCSTRTVVEIHSWTKALSVSAIVAAQLSSVPTVCTLHDYFWVCPNGGFYDFVTGGICNRTPLGLACIACNCDSRSYGVKLYRWLKTALQRIAIGVAGRPLGKFCVSEFSARVIEQNLSRGARVVVVDNPLGVAPTGQAAPETSNRFVFVGRLSPEKGARLLAKAAQLANVAVAFVGEGPEDQYIRECNPRAAMLGWKNSDEVQTIIRSSRCLVFPSLWYETQGLVVAEAAAAGIPVIVSDKCAAVDFVKEANCGLHYRSGSVEDLAATLRLLARDDGLVKRLGAQAYASYSRVYCSNAFAAKKRLRSYQFWASAAQAASSNVL